MHTASHGFLTYVVQRHGSHCLVPFAPYVEDVMLTVVSFSSWLPDLLVLAPQATPTLPPGVNVCAFLNNLLGWILGIAGVFAIFWLSWDFVAAFFSTPRNIGAMIKDAVIGLCFLLFATQSKTLVTTALSWLGVTIPSC